VNGKPSQARDLYDEICGHTDPGAFLAGKVKGPEPWFEDEYLDFIGNPANDADRNRNWYTAISGYGNSGDGLIIWGIDARPNPARKIDAAGGFRLIPNPLAFRSKLNELKRKGTDTPLAGVEIKHFPFPGNPNEGFVVCLIPEGVFKPYRAEIQGAPQYYIRAGDQFVIPTPSTLRALFHPRYQARFKVRVYLEYETTGSDPRDRANFTCRVWLTNAGTATAQQLMVIPSLAGFGELDTIVSGTWNSGRQPTRELAFWSGQSAHPGLSLWPFQLNWTSPLRFDVFTRGAPAGPDVNLRLSFYAENHAPQYAEAKFILTDAINGKWEDVETESADVAPWTV
jgi:hypothetical protein